MASRKIRLVRNGMPAPQAPPPGAPMGEGLAAALPPDEHVVWQGAPDHRTMARSLHLRGFAAYFAVLLTWYATDRAIRDPASLIPGLARAAILAACALLILAAYAWLVARNTRYVLTTRRLIMQVGIALPMSFNIPFARIANAAAKHRADGSGDIVLTLQKGDRISYLVLWPHVRPWRVLQAEPMLRALPDIATVSATLGRLLADHAALPPIQDHATPTTAPTTGPTRPHPATLARTAA